MCCECPTANLARHIFAITLHQLSARRKSSERTNMRWYSQQLVAMKNAKRLSECTRTPSRLWLCERVNVRKILESSVRVRTTQDRVWFRWCHSAGRTPEKWLGQTGALSGCHDTQSVTSGYSQGWHTAGTAKRGAQRSCQTHRERTWHHFPLKRHILPLLLAAGPRERTRERGCFGRRGQLAIRHNWRTNFLPSVNEVKAHFTVSLNFISGSFRQTQQVFSSWPLKRGTTRAKFDLRGPGLHKTLLVWTLHLALERSIYAYVQSRYLHQLFNTTAEV